VKPQVKLDGQSALEKQARMQRWLAVVTQEPPKGQKSSAPQTGAQ